MSNYEVIVNFDVNDLEILKSKISLEDVTFFTNDLIILDKIKQLGYRIEYIAQYFGEFTPDGDLINDESIRRLKIFEESLNDENLECSSLVYGLRYTNLQNLLFLEKIRKILVAKQNVVFLFNNLAFYYFAIPDIADTIEHQSKFGLAQIVDSDLVPLNFQTRLRKFRFLQHQLEEMEYTDDEEKIDSFSSRLSDFNFKAIDPKYAFFLVNNETDFYLKPIYPVLNKFNEKGVESILFTFDSRTHEQLLEKGFYANDLSGYFYGLSLKMRRINLNRASFKSIIIFLKKNLSIKSFKKSIRTLKKNLNRNRFKRKTRRFIKRQTNIAKANLLRFYLRHLQKYGLFKRFLTKPKIKRSLLNILGEPDDEFSFIDFVYDAPQREIEVVLNFLKRIRELKTDDVVLKSYLRYINDGYIINRLVRILLTHAIVDQILRRFNFRSIMVQVDAGPLNNVVCNIAKNYNIQTYSIPQLFIKIPKISPILPMATKIIVSGQKVKDEFVRLEVDENKIIVTGSPRYDYISHNLKLKQEYKFEDSNSSKKLIIVAMSRWHENDDRWMSQLVQFCNSNNLDILFKVHPMYKFSTNNDYSEEMIRRITENCSGLKYTVSYEADLSNLLPRAKVVITEYSIVAVEAAFNETPVIIANFNNEKNSDYSLAYLKEGIALYTTTIQELFDSINKILYDANTKQQLNEAIKRFNYGYNYLNDGNASQRVFDLLMNSESEKITVSQET